MENILHKLNREKTNFYIFGDFNINLFLSKDSNNISDFVSSMHSHSASNLVNIATKFPRGKQHGSPSLLDHIWTNQPHFVKNIDLNINPISDHRPMLTIIKLNISKTTLYPVSYFIRDMTNFSMESYNESLFNFPLSAYQNSTIKLQTHINKCIDIHAPL